MKLYKIVVQNYRLLREFSIDLEDELSLVLGKNNTGKTSILSVLDKFLNQDKGKFAFDDFNIEFKKCLKESIENTEFLELFEECGIKLKLFIKYGETDNLANVSRVMMDLDPDNNVVVLGFEYMLEKHNFIKLKSDYYTFKIKEAEKFTENENYIVKGVYDFLKRNLTDYFEVRKRSYQFDVATQKVDETNFINLLKEEVGIRDIINFKYIKANRDVTNSEIDKTLSGQTSKLYKKSEESDEQNAAIEEFKDSLSETDTQLSGIYKDLFDEIIEKVKLFGGITLNESDIAIISTLQHRELLDGNTTVVYKHDPDHQLPENYNGLGYMNLISMIFEIEILVKDFKRNKNKQPADVNLLFIEEPEAHTHPQMQYVFIKNIKTLLKEGILRADGVHRELQYIISTHSSHIVADSDFNDIKYLKKDSINGVVAKNLKDLEKDYDVNTPQYQFLKQYLTVSRAEIFFAEKAILIEGDTERILIPTLMRKIDIEEKQRHADAGTKDVFLPLLSQNISIVEVGAYSQIFQKFIEFLGIKAVIITDLDSTDNESKACPVSEGVNYSNTALSYFFREVTLEVLMGYAIQNKILGFVVDHWEQQENGRLCLIYQVMEDGYTARSFEDAFIHINRDFINNHKASFEGLKLRAKFDDNANDAYVLARDCIQKKTHFALDILYHSDENFSNWKIPSYISEGLLWLKQD